MHSGFSSAKSNRGGCAGHILGFSEVTSRVILALEKQQSVGAQRCEWRSTRYSEELERETTDRLQIAHSLNHGPGYYEIRHTLAHIIVNNLRASRTNCGCCPIESTGRNPINGNAISESDTIQGCSHRGLPRPQHLLSQACLNGHR